MLQTLTSKEDFMKYFLDFFYIFRLIWF